MRVAIVVVREWQKRNSQGIEQEMNILFEVCVSIIVIAVISRRIVESLFNRKKESAKLRGKLQVRVLSQSGSIFIFL